MLLPWLFTTTHGCTGRSRQVCPNKLGSRSRITSTRAVSGNPSAVLSETCHFSFLPEVDVRQMARSLLALTGQIRPVTLSFLEPDGQGRDAPRMSQGPEKLQ